MDPTDAVNNDESTMTTPRKGVATSRVDSMKVTELKKALGERKLKTTGSKADLIKRFKAALLMDDEKDNQNDDDDEDEADVTIVNTKASDHDDDDDSSYDESDEDNAEEDECLTCTTKTQSKLKYIPTFKDVEESMETFSGDGTTNIGRWLTEFEETAALCEWAEVQKIIYAKRLLRGSAKIFVNHEKCCKSWKRMKRALKEEFAHRTNSHDVHKELARRKKKPDETHHQYIYTMIDIGARANVETKAIIQYIIDGINDDEINKIVLYGAKNIRELKAKFGTYEAMKASLRTKQKHGDISRKAAPQKEAADQRCFSCGERDHVKSNCPLKDKGRKCFRCNGFGHIAAKCSGNERKNYCNVIDNVKTDSKPKKTVSIGSKQFMALIDSGSDLSLIKLECCSKIGISKLDESITQFRGAGPCNVTTLGQVHMDIAIDGNTYNVLLRVVNNDIIRHDMLLGSDFLNTVDVHMKQGNVTIYKINRFNSSNDSEISDVFKIDVISNKDTDLAHINDVKHRNEVETMIKNYQPKRPKKTDVQMRIILTDEAPVCQRARRLSLSEKEDVDTQINVWLKEGIIRPSVSDFASPIVLVRKKDGSTRICVDYRKLNEKVIKDRYPLPIIEDHLDRLQKAKVFSTIDLKNGFFHTKIEESSIKYTAFVVPNGHYEFLRVPFGLCNSPAVFQRYINHIFRELIAANILLIYIDDLIIPSVDCVEGVRNLRKVLEVASEYGLNVNWHKSVFLQGRVDYLGYVIENGHIEPSVKKVLAVKRFTKPTCTKSVQSFLGLAGYFRKFMCNYALVAKPLTRLLRANVKFQFGQEEEQAFEQLKLMLMNKPILKLYDPKAETELHTDASSIGYGAIILQKDSEKNVFQPIYYASGTTTPAEAKYCSYELEVLAIVRALKKFRVYLLGIDFKIVTDCKAFTCTMKKRDLSVRIARWALLLEEFSYSVEHRSSCKMSHVDALSRYPLPSVLLIEERYNNIIAKLEWAQRKDGEVTKLIETVKQGNTDEYLLRNGLLYKKVNDEIFVIVPRLMQESVIRLSHEKGHFSADKTEKLVRRDYWFSGMRNKIETVVRNCIRCILADKKQGKREGFLHVIDKGNVPLDVFHVDHIGPLPSTSKRYRHIFLVVDAFSKYVWLYPVRSTDTAEMMERLRKQAVIFGNPRRIISDRGSAYTAQAFEEYCREEGIEHVTVTTGMPRSNGQVERMNRILISILTKLAAPKPDNWYKHVEATQKCINSTPTRSTGFAPFNILFGTRMRLRDDMQVKELLEQENVLAFEEERDHVRNLARGSILKIQEENKKTFNRKRKKPNSYETNDLVAIKRTQHGPGQKLHEKFLGPYRVSRVLRNDRYLVSKIGEHEGPHNTSTSAEFMKPWPNGSDVLLSDESDFE